MKYVSLIFALCLIPAVAFGSGDPYSTFRSQCNSLTLNDVYPNGVPNDGPRNINEVCNKIINEARMHQSVPNMSGKEFAARLKCSGGAELVVAAMVIDWGPDFFVAPLVRKARSGCKAACRDMAKFCPAVNNICDAHDVGRWIDILKRDNNCEEFK